ncbi:hypothetical protein MKZ38_001554 [Zalerion maritima]|uniref:Fumarylacetoacetase n=1 Tax=Zalerion maritima TaxID=339359 RepID=A0AAD5RR32_9PEZI|nr:hypothetical protein MKZ38_001554 [Zalerion maritima]
MSGYTNHFSLDNLPYGVASRDGCLRSVVTRVNDQVYFLNRLPINVSEEIKEAVDQPTLNALAALEKSQLLQLREEIRSSVTIAASATAVNFKDVTMHMPVDVPGFTDFSCSKEHTLNAGEAVMGIRKLPPGMLHFPVGYTGRSSSIVVSGTPILRPYGQFRGAKGEVVFGPSQQLDYEMELGCIIGKPSKFGERVSVNDADEHIFGLVLVNDWSARDIQGLEMVPLGPVNGKSFGTTISPWVITLEALEPFRTEAPKKDPAPAAYLNDLLKKNSYRLDLTSELVEAGKSREDDKATTRLCKAKLEWMYWTFRDLVAQQTINGCNINTGDILATGTVSGLGDDEHGCLLEVTKGGKVDFKISSGASRTYLQDGDEVTMTAVAADGIGFGECSGKILPATPFD